MHKVLLSKGILLQRIHVCALYTDSVHLISGLYKHSQQQCNKMHLHVTMFVSVCTIIARQVYCMLHTCINRLVCTSVLCTWVCENVPL